jgi:hypothetical protein
MKSLKNFEKDNLLDQSKVYGGGFLGYTLGWLAGMASYSGEGLQRMDWGPTTKL